MGELSAEAVVAAVVVFARAAAAAAVEAVPGDAGCVGLSELAGCLAPGDSDGGSPH